MMKHQVKFYVDDDEKRRLEVLAQLRHMSVPTYVKLTALGVKVQQVKEVFIESENLFSKQEEKQMVSDEVITLSEEDKAVLEEILTRKKGFLQFNNGFNERLEQMAKRLLGKEVL